MIQEDTIKLLRECNAGIKMGVSSIDEVLPKTKDTYFKDLLTASREEHDRLEGKTTVLLHKYSDEGKEPNSVAKGMSWIKTNVMMAMDENDKTVASLITDGCNMGVKSLSRYLNQYKAADEESKGITKELIRVEEDLAVKIRDYL